MQFQLNASDKKFVAMSTGKSRIKSNKLSVCYKILSFNMMLSPILSSLLTTILFLSYFEFSPFYPLLFKSDVHIAYTLLYNYSSNSRRMIIKECIQRADGSFHYRQYLKQQRLGKGGFAQCFVAERTCDKKKYALKIISKKCLEKPKARQKMLSEIALHRRAKHKNICQLERAFEDDENVYMLLQLCTNGNMFQMIRRRKKLTVPQTQFFIYQLIDALCYLHSRQMIHRDVKLGNLLIDANMNLKLADFGLTTKLQFKGDLKHTVCGTPNYIAPQIIRGSMSLGASGHSYEVDIWSTGVIMYLMLIGKAPFQTNAVQKTYSKISKGIFDFPDSFKDNEAKDLLRKILVVDPSKRYTFQQILAHPFMNPKCGIPKQLPLVSLNQAPKFGVFQKYAQEPVKKSARDASVLTLRSSVDLSLQQDLQGLETQKSNVENDTSKKASKDVKGLLRSVFSTSSLSKSLQKLSDLGRSSSPQAKNIKGIQPIRLSTSGSTSRLNLSANKAMSSLNGSQVIRQSMGESEIQQMQMSLKKKQLGFVYILQYNHEATWNYQLSNGYTGTYESGLQYLYNSHNNLYIQIQGGQIKLLKKSDEAGNQRLSHRRKFLRKQQYNQLQCEPFLNKERLIYLIKIFKVESERIILFRLSNGTIQAHDYGKNINLLLTENDLIMIQIENGKQVSKIVESKQNYAKCPNKMVEIYLQVKRIMNKINSKKN